MSHCLKFALASALACSALLSSAQALSDPNSVVLAGLQVAQSIDKGRYDEVWNGASPVMKKLATKGQFVDSLVKSRQQVGAAPTTNRVWIDVSRREFSGTPALPAGVYVNVGYQTTFANGKTARELVSFRLDEDKSWRVTGYVLN